MFYSIAESSENSFARILLPRTRWGGSAQPWSPSVRCPNCQIGGTHLLKFALRANDKWAIGFCPIWQLGHFREGACLLNLRNARSHSVMPCMFVVLVQIVTTQASLHALEEIFVSMHFLFCAWVKIANLSTGIILFSVDWHISPAGKWKNWKMTKWKYILQWSLNFRKNIGLLRYFDPIYNEVAMCTEKKTPKKRQCSPRALLSNVCLFSILFKSNFTQRRQFPLRCRWLLRRSPRCRTPAGRHPAHRTCCLLCLHQRETPETQIWTPGCKVNLSDNAISLVFNLTSIPLQTYFLAHALGLKAKRDDDCCVTASRTRDQTWLQVQHWPVWVGATWLGGSGTRSSPGAPSAEAPWPTSFAPGATDTSVSRTSFPARSSVRLRSEPARLSSCEVASVWMGTRAAAWQLKTQNCWVTETGSSFVGANLCRCSQ